MVLFFWGLIAVAAYYNIKIVKSKKAKRIFIGLYASLFIIGFAYFSGEKIGEALYYFSH